MRLVLFIFWIFQCMNLIQTNCPCCNVNYRPICQNCNLIQRIEPLIVLPNVPFKRNQTLHSMPIPPFKGKWSLFERKKIRVGRNFVW